MKSIRLDFCDFHPGHRKTNNFFYHLLEERFAVELCDHLDFLIYSCFGHQHRLMNGIKIFLTRESALPNWNECDYALTCHELDMPRHLRLPLYVLYGEPEGLTKSGEKPERILAQRLLDFFERVFAEKIEPVSNRRQWSALGRWTFAKRHHVRGQ